jgi:hypothetical protein
MLRVEVAEPLPEETRSPEAPPIPPIPVEEREAAPEAPAPPAPEPVTLAELYDRDRGKRFGDKVHRLLELFPPLVPRWPPKFSVHPVEWAEGEEQRWEGIVAAVRSSDLFPRLCSSRLIGTEVPMLGFHGGYATEDRADLIVRAPEGAGSPDEHWVIDYKTGWGDPDQEERHFLQVREYCAILAQAWGVPVRGFIWYVESGEAVEVT